MRIDAAGRLWIMEIKLNIQSKKRKNISNDYFYFLKWKLFDVLVVKIVGLHGRQTMEPGEDSGEEELSARQNKHDQSSTTLHLLPASM